MILRAESICKSYGGEAVLEDLSLQVEAGSFCALLGATGVGKTTLLRILAGIEKPDSGRVFYDGVDVTEVPVQDRPIAFVYQQFVNYPSMTLFENIASPLRVSKSRLLESEIREKVDQVAGTLGLQDVLQHLPEEVSGGQKQRCAIARALVKEARFIFMDAPLANLDYKLREELRSELKQIFGGVKSCEKEVPGAGHPQLQGAVVCATPEPIDVLMMASHVAFLHNRNVLQFGDVQEVYQHPAHAAVASYFSYPQMNLVECTVTGQDGLSVLKVTDELKIKVDLGQDRLADDHYLLGIRPHHLDMRPAYDRMVPFNAEVELAEVVGSNTELHLKHGNLRMTLFMDRVERFAVGDKVTPCINPSQIYLFDATTGEFVARTS
jgi:glycerol transport system ATP-binding protein